MEHGRRFDAYYITTRENMQLWTHCTFMAETLKLIDCSNAQE